MNFYALQSLELLLARGMYDRRTEATQSTEGQKRYCWVTKKERTQMERQARCTGQAREFKNRVCRLFPTERLPRIEHYNQKTQRRWQVKEREEAQIQDHHERMLRGRELTEERLKERLLKTSQGQLPSLEKLQRVKKDMKGYERANGHPLLHLRSRTLIKLESLLEKSQAGKEMKAAMKPRQKKFLTLPPFLKSQARKRKDL
ncbi:putative uncharacterized protein ZNRD1-AS1 [Meriones unguiculatus]|uniref:putative uncharacterized protein ZNRD1-AS1 n=1 Tax=Meriones unguiculatus TaxID=10047 RepID=UPI000B4EE6FD|nr:putative uncharacterized protein ZNRD1-AS1 [Meriones unguiculatus]